MKFNEDSRVKIPSILHLTRLGYTYLSLKGLEWDASSNIVPSLFCESVSAINPSATSSEIETALAHLDLVLDNEDLGKQFYEKITQTSGLKIVDFEDFDRNSFHVVTEFTCKKGDEEFRPDITLLINGLPLVFIEVKKPNNRDGILAERNRFPPLPSLPPPLATASRRSRKARRRAATAVAPPSKIHHPVN